MDAQVQDFKIYFHNVPNSGGGVGNVTPELVSSDNVSMVTGGVNV